MAKVIIFGIRDYSQLAHFYLSIDSVHEVVAFSVNASYMTPNENFLGLPVIAFEEIKEFYPPDEYKFFAPMSPSKMNTNRENVFKEIKGMGYDCISYISSKATNFSESIGENCFILEDNTIQPFVKIGNNVVLWSGNHIGHHGSIGDNTTFTSHVVLSGHCNVGKNCFFGVNSTIKNHLSIADGTLISMGSVVEESTDPWSIYRGSPAKKSIVPSTRARI